MKIFSKIIGKKQIILFIVFSSLTVLGIIPSFVRAQSYYIVANQHETPIGIITHGNYLSTHYNDGNSYDVLAVSLWPVTPLFYFYVASGVDFPEPNPSYSYPTVKLYLKYEIVYLAGCKLSVVYYDSSRDEWSLSNGLNYKTFTLDANKKVYQVGITGFSWFAPGTVKIDYASIYYNTV